MASLVDFAKVVFARIYPFLVWGTLTGLAVHAGLKSQFIHGVFDEAVQASINEDVTSRDSAPVYVDQFDVNEDASDRRALL